MTLPSYDSVNELIIHKVPDLNTWINNYGSDKDIKPEDIVVFPPSLINLSGKQDVLVSGTNIKTINNTSLLGSGNIAVQPTLVSGTNIKTVNNNSLLGSGNIAVQPTLVSGTNIKTINNTSLLGSGDITVQVPLVAGTDYVQPATLNNYILTSLKGANNGVAELDSNGKIKATQASARLIALSQFTTLQDIHDGCIFYNNTTSARSLTIKSLYEGFECEVLKYNTGNVTINADTDVYLNGVLSGSKQITERYTSAVLKAIDATHWVIQGAIS